MKLSTDGQFPVACPKCAGNRKQVPCGHPEACYYGNPIHPDNRERTPQQLGEALRRKLADSV